MAEQYQGFSKEAKQLIARLEEYGVTFRVSSKGHAIGKAPHDLGTISIGRKLSLHNRSQQNAESSAARIIQKIKMYERTYAPDVNEKVQQIGRASEALLDTEPGTITDKIIMRGMERKADEIVDAVRNTEPVIMSEHPWMAHKAASASGGTMYESATTRERRWSDGTLDYVCALPGCGYTSPRPVSVARHYGRSNDHPKAAEQPVVPGKDYFEAFTSRHTPSEGRVQAILALLASHKDAASGATLDELVRLILAADMERDPLYERGEVVREGDESVIGQIRSLVSPQLVAENSELRERCDALFTRAEELSGMLEASQNEVDRLQGNLSALRDLLTDAS
jgi:hypothetical protein